MATGYEDIEQLTNKQNEMLDSALQQQQDITNKQTEMNVAELERNKEEIDKDATKTNKALYTEYQKAKNPYGANAEQLASQGLGNSGYAESTQTNLYNTFQKNVTDTLNNARDLKADFDFQISKARQNGDITLAQNALAIYNQKMQLLTQEYELKNNREQFLYQKERDKVSDNHWQQEYDYQKEQDTRNYNYQVSRDKVSDKQWQKTYDYNKSRDKVSDKQWQKTFDYQKGRDKVSDSQWEKEYQLSKKASASSSKKSYSKTSSSKKSSGTTSDLMVPKDDNTKKNTGNNNDDPNKKNTTNNAKETKKKATTKNNTYTRTILPSATQTVASRNKMTDASRKALQADIYEKVKKGQITEKQAQEMFEKMGL